MFEILRPRLFATSIYQLDLAMLWEMGMRAVVTDLDNTLIEWNNSAAAPQLVAWLDHLRQHGFRVCIVSNNDQSRVESFATPLGVPAISKARKPRRSAFLRALQITETDASHTIMLGDQVFTDILGGNRMGMYTILVRPIHGREAWGTRMVRFVERMVLGSEYR